MTDRPQSGPRVAVFRPDDERLAGARDRIVALGGVPVLDPMLEIEPTGAIPRTDAEVVILTSKTGVELVAEAGWNPEDMLVCAIGTPTAEALESAGYGVDVIPEEFSSTGLVETLKEDLPGTTVEVARSDHGSPALLEGIMTAGGYVHETVLYRLKRPEDAGHSVEMAADGTLDLVLFTSSLTVEHFMAIAAERDLKATVRDGLDAAVVGAIGTPTRETAERHGIEVDFVPPTATFEALVKAGIELVTSDSKD